MTRPIFSLRGLSLTAGQKAIIRKDLREILVNKQILLPIVLVPAIMMVLMPTILFIAAHYADLGNPRVFQDTFKALPFLHRYPLVSQKIIVMAVTFYLPFLFLLIPIMASSMVGAGCFISEKEHKTLETLLSCPLTIDGLFRAKVYATFVASYGITLLTFVLLTVVVNVGGFWYFGTLIFPTPEWLITVFWLSPGISLFGLIIIVFISATSRSFQESQQVVGFVVVPFILTLVGQAIGLFLVNAIVLVVGGALILALDLVLFRIAKRKLTPDILLR